MVCLASHDSQTDCVEVVVTWFVSEHGRCCLAGSDRDTAETGRCPGLQHHGRIHGESRAGDRESDLGGGGGWLRTNDRDINNLYTCL